MLPPHKWLLAAIASVFFRLTRGLEMSYCSPDNTGQDEGFGAIYNSLQSNGACQQNCQDDYAYAVLQGGDCWCSNYAPSDEQNTSSCDEPCPGYPYDWCGSTASGLYAYFFLTVSPSGTLYPSTSQAPSSTYVPPSSSSVSPTPSPPGTPFPSSSTVESTPSTEASITSLTSFAVVQTPVTTSSSIAQSSSATPVPVSMTPRSSRIAPPSTLFTLTSSSVYTPPPSSSPSPSPEASSSRQPSSSPTPAPVATQAITTVETVTGQPRTVVITPSATADPALGQGSVSSNGISKGTVAGIVVGCALGLGLLIGVVVFFALKRKHAKEDGAAAASPGFGPTYHQDAAMDPSKNVPSRQVSQMSQAGLLATKVPRIQTNGYGASNGPRSADTTGGFSSDRRSVGTDQRLNPYALYAHDESRLSNVSLQDNQDYSRQLRVANPDE